jgi:predicted nuclease with RNAse H fold
MRVVGVDVGARRLHAVALDGATGVAVPETFNAADLALVVDWLTGADAIAVDAPDRWSTAPHADDAALAPKFRTARCGEIGLGRRHRIWVSWTTPVEPAPGWIQVGVDLFAAVRAAGLHPVETYPYAVFRTLAGADSGRLPRKQSREGASARRALLASAGVTVPPEVDRSHDLLDAAAAALVARHRVEGSAQRVTCGHDGSAIWLPAPVPVPVGAPSRGSAPQRPV